MRRSSAVIISRPLPRRWFGSSSSSASSTVNGAEVSKFSKVGKEWWDANSKAGTGPLHAMNPTRVAFIREEATRLRPSQRLLPPMSQLKGLSVLDVGCGGGLLSESLARLGGKVTAIDPSPQNIAIAKEHSASSAITRENIRYLHCDVEAMVKAGETFDLVCSLEVVEHVDDLDAFIAQCAACVQPKSGSLFLSTLNRTTKSYLLAILAAEQLLRVVPPGTHQWEKFITPKELSSYVQREGLIVQRTVGLVMDDIPPIAACKLFSRPASLHWTLHETDLDVNYIMHATKGLISPSATDI